MKTPNQVAMAPNALVLPTAGESTSITPPAYVCCIFFPYILLSTGQRYKYYASRTCTNYYCIHCTSGSSDSSIRQHSAKQHQ